MLELILPVAMKYSKDGNDEFTYRTFTEDDIDDLIAPFQKAAQAYAENHAEEVTT